MPNAFSPNGDGMNDTFGIMGAGIESATLIIFDRYGNMVYSGEYPNARWDGTYKGADCELGVYVYWVEGKFTSGKTFIEKGNVTLMK